MASKLHINFHNEDMKQQQPVIENIIHELIKESSVRTRRHIDTIATSLSTRPQSSQASHKPASFPRIQSNELTDQKQDLTVNSKTNKSDDNSLTLLKNQTSIALSPMQETRPATAGPSIGRRTTTSVRYTGDSGPYNFHKSKVSNQNWIPEISRFQNINRDIRVAKQNLDDCKTREEAANRIVKRHTFKTDLDKAHAEERCGSTKKIACGCCQQPYLYVNLPKTVTMKAIIDIRLKWSGKLRSDTVYNTEWKSPTKADDSAIITSVAPRLYDTIRVCNFCAQFFQDQTSYRPSYSMLLKEEKRKILADKQEREKEYWDPLKQCEKNREILELENPTYLSAGSPTRIG